jgi:putative transposase
LRATNPIESTFANLRPPHHPIEGLSIERESARNGLQTGRGRTKNWRRLDGHNQLPKLVLGVTFCDGIEVIAKPTNRHPVAA